ncbi:MBL fold metallo-hydrolase [Costertonia aggregata]|uniref:MBL fold metallo-hydrolase n=1 Tax=Costertonia aggregata TaxID=343403 RepID=A0A7H9AQD7_9FLAO|nr:MBL fold metallo-hydrolase [Costertonia aggregata]QLG45617.1 MBL fold metallo-hydrolase [Costertonia aggregata]
MGLFFVGFLLAMVVAVFLFINFSPEFGGTPTKEQKMRYATSKNYGKGAFKNIGDVQMNMGFGVFVKSLRGYIAPQPHTKPEKDISVEKIDSISISLYEGPMRLIWFGHSAFLLQSGGKNILIDPMFGDVPAPHPMLGGKRFSSSLPIEIEKLPKIDAVIFSHDHYDHLDYGSVKLLKEKVGVFYTPLGVGVHLTEWGVDQSNIIELDWWGEVNFQGLRFICTPAQHFSGRGITDGGSTLWSSWVIQTASENIFFSGDSGYGAHFKEIGDIYGPFDFAMLECGQYNELWKEIHMMPEEAAQAGLDIKAKKIMPIHWGSFKLAMHPWTEPVSRILKKATELNIPVTVPKIGEPIYLDTQNISKEKWWEAFN